MLFTTWISRVCSLMLVKKLARTLLFDLSLRELLTLTKLWNPSFNGKTFSAILTAIES